MKEKGTGFVYLTGDQTPFVARPRRRQEGISQRLAMASDLRRPRPMTSDNDQNGFPRQVTEEQIPPKLRRRRRRRRRQDKQTIE